MKKAPKKVPLNLLGEDAILANKIKAHLEKKMGQLTAVSVARIVYRSYAEREGIR